jgi:ATP synthase protein I
MKLEEKSIWRYLGMATELCLALLVPSLLGVFLGIFIDKSFNITPVFTLLMLILGLITGIRSMWKLVADR